MSAYFKCAGIIRDELLGGTGVVYEVWNITVGEGTTIERGMLLAAEKMSGVFAPVESADDAKKTLVIAAKDFVATEEQKVTQAYTSGVFNREGIKLPSALTLEPFEDTLRMQNIHFSGLF